jgi:predicted phage terminase large subunit-like protein
VPVAWAPSPGPQTEALLCEADELLYGGAAGGGKTDFLLVAALADVTQTGYKAVIFRRTYPELESSVIDRARFLIPTIRGFEGAVENTSKHEWSFPSRSRLLFRHLEDDAAAVAHRSAEYQYLGFDELTTFTERQYRYLMSRLRTSKGHRLRVRAASNPGGPGHSWVLKRWAPWLDPEYRGADGKAVSGEIRYYLTHPDTGADVWVPKGTPGAMSRCFIAARLDDNPHLDAGYADRLNAQDPLTRKQLKDGDWSAKPAPKTFFDRAWCPRSDSLPDDLRCVRGWDRAATEEGSGKDPDWTGGVKLGYSEKTALWYLLDVVRLRASPGGVRQKVLETARADGPNVEQVLPCDPGSAGVFEAQQWLSDLAGYVVNVQRETGDKVTRAKTWSAQFAPAPGQAHGRFRYVPGPWCAEYFTELEDFPTPKVHDDQVDATSTAFRVLVEGGGGGGGLSEADYRRGHRDLDEHDEGWDSRRRPSGGGGLRWRKG